MPVQNKRNLSHAKFDSKINSRFLLNEHGDLYFFIAYIIIVYSEHGDLSFLFFFFDTVFGIEHSSFISEELPLSTGEIEVLLGLIKKPCVLTGLKKIVVIVRCTSTSK